MSRYSPWLLAALVLSVPARARAQDINDLQEKAIKAAVHKVAPSVVQIVTQGGTDMVVTSPKGPVFRKALGPTTGVIASADGYVISSAINFINEPTNILVSVIGQPKPYIARRVATDRSRMLTLLKIDAQGLPVPAAAPRKDIQVGQWAIALGRTLDVIRDRPPAVSVGIISATGRIYGKALQTDAKISPVNYGGPLVDVRGRVQGILVPAAPDGEDATAGFEWYDSGIGFAIPFEDVLAILPRLKQGRDLHRGLLGVRLQGADIYTDPPKVGQVMPKTAAAAAGLKPGDLITEIDGRPIARMTDIQHALGTHYEGDHVALKFKRGDKEIAIPDLQLVGDLISYAHGYLGVLPLRDDPRPGEEIRYVYPKSPADKAGLKAGDRIVGFERNKKMIALPNQKSGVSEVFDAVNSLPPGSDFKMEVIRKDGKKELVTARLSTVPGATADNPDDLPERLPPASLKKALAPLVAPGAEAKEDPPKKKDDDEKAIETGLLKRKNVTGDHQYWVYVHDDYDPNVAHALVIWLHPPGKNSEEDMKDFANLWDSLCQDYNIILLLPKSDNDRGWLPGEADHVLEAARDVMSRYTIDRRRVVAHGMGIGGQMAFHLGFTARDLIRGVATTGSAANVAKKDNLSNRRLSFYLMAGDRDPLFKAVAETRTKLVERNFPVFFREVVNMGRQYPTEDLLRDLGRWIDVLDRQ
jgi:S1-C subfamily serine protease